MNKATEAANEYLDKIFGEGNHQRFYVELFVAGAEWQEHQSLLETVDWLKTHILLTSDELELIKKLREEKSHAEKEKQKQ